MAARLAPVALFVLLAPSVIAGLPESAIEGLVLPIKPVSGTGSFLAAPGAFLFMAGRPLASGQESILSAAAGTLIVDEWRWRSAMPAADPVAPATADHYSTQRRLGEFSAAISNNGPSSRIEFVSSETARQAVAKDLSTCIIEPHIAGLTRTALAKGEASSLAPHARSPIDAAMLRVHCTSGQTILGVSGPDRVALQGVMIRIQSGTQRFTLETGLTSSRAEDAGGQVFENLLRQVRFEEIKEGGLALHGADLQFVGPLFFWTGELSLSGFLGVVTWGEQTFNDWRHPLGFDGGFFLGAKTDEASRPRIEIAGAGTANAGTVAPASGVEGDVLAWIVAGAAALGLVGMRALRLLKSVFLAAFTRVAAAKALDHPNRNQLRQLVDQNPGIRAFEAARMLGISRATLAFHVAMLERHGQLLVHRGPRFVSFFPASTTRSDVERQTALREPHVAQLLKEIQRHPTITQVQLGAKLRLSQTRVGQIVRGLEDAGLLVRRRVAAGTAYRASR